jgi:hypothetical protein
MTKFHCRAICLIAVGAIPLALNARAVLDGTRWKVKLRPEGGAAVKGEKPIDDELIFADGKVTSTACQKYGFGASAYCVEGKHGMLTWETEQVSDNQGMGKTQWYGRLSAEKIAGKMIWRKADGTKLVYGFSGKKEKLEANSQ